MMKTMIITEDKSAAKLHVDKHDRRCSPRKKSVSSHLVPRNYQSFNFVC